MQWIRSHITADGKHSFCEFGAPNAEACRKHASIAGLPVDDVAPGETRLRRSLRKLELHAPRRQHKRCPSQGPERHQKNW